MGWGWGGRRRWRGRRGGQAGIEAALDECLLTDAELELLRLAAEPDAVFVDFSADPPRLVDLAPPAPPGAP